MGIFARRSRVDSNFKHDTYFFAKRADGHDAISSGREKRRLCGGEFDGCRDYGFGKHDDGDFD